MSSTVRSLAEEGSRGTADPTAPIGVFDSGVGGLSVLREIRAALPAEHLIYLADSAHAPYGDRDVAFVRQRASRMVDALIAQGVKAVVIACNTASVVAAEALRAVHAVPIVAMEPAIKPAVQLSRSGVITVLATRQTLASNAVETLVATHRGETRIILQACPGLVERIERGDLDGPVTRDLVARFLAPTIEAGSDVVVLGCTHYPFVRPLLTQLLGEDVAVIDSAAAVAARLKTRVADIAMPHGEGRVRYLSTARGLAVQSVVDALWGNPLQVEAVAA